MNNWTTDYFIGSAVHVAVITGFMAFCRKRIVLLVFAAVVLKQRPHRSTTPKIRWFARGATVDLERTQRAQRF